LDLNGVGYCIMDNFAGNTDTIKVGALNMGVQQYLDEHVEISLYDLVEDLLEHLRITMTSKQQDIYYNRLVKNIKVAVRDGVLKLELKEA
jgi:hypothetical protein